MSKKKRALWWRILRVVLIAGPLLLAGWASIGLAMAWTPMGKMATGERLERMKKSPQFGEETFIDVLPRIEPDVMEILPEWFAEPHPFRRPQEPLSVRKGTKKDFATPPQTGTRITWLGHSTLIIEIEKKRILIDPVWGSHVAPLELENAERFVPPPLPFEELPDIDAVVISHDHYDHLDYPTMTKLAKASDAPFFVPLGIGAHLEYWGVPVDRIKERDWWQETMLGDLKIVCTPARHFSGRSLWDRDATLWASWTFIGKEQRLFYSGDTAMFPGFKDIGERYGPFDATMIENGAYNRMWADVHLGPEQAVEAHKMLGGGLLIPVHWGMFDLGLHGWTEPIERILIAAKKDDVRIATLRPGESVEPNAPPPFKKWWPDRPFDTAEVHPIVSSGLKK